jgi:hypothetical protein
MEKHEGSKKSVDPTRRTLIIGIPAAIIAGSVGRLVVDALREEEAPEEEPQKPPIKKLTPEQRKNTYSLLQQKYPELLKNPYHLLELEDEDAYRFLETCSLQDLQNFGILRGTEQPFDYMNLETVWKRAVRLNPAREPYRKKFASAREEKLTLESLADKLKKGIARFSQEILKKADLGNGFSKFITPEVMLAIFVQEIAPGEMPAKLKIKPKARLELFRMMCEAGWQPQKMPAIYDTAISFGLGQMTLPTHEGLQRAHGAETNGFIEPDFLKHTSSEQQILNSLLLSYDNLDAFHNLAKKYPNFLRVFEAAKDEQKKRFLTTVLAAFHNYGNRSSLRRRIRSTLESREADLETYRTEFLKNIRSLTAFRHAHNSGALYSFVAHRAEALAPELAREDVKIPKPPEAAPEAAEQDIMEDTLLVRVKPHGKTGKRMAYYTFTAPDADLRIIFSYILQGAKLEDVMRFQEVSQYKPGDIVFLPLEYLPEDTKDRRFARIPTRGKPPLELMEQYMEGGGSDRNRCLAILYGTTREELRFPARLLKD